MWLIYALRERIVAGAVVIEKQRLHSFAGRSGRALSCLGTLCSLWTNVMIIPKTLGLKCSDNFHTCANIINVLKVGSKLSEIFLHFLHTNH